VVGSRIHRLDGRNAGHLPGVGRANSSGHGPARPAAAEQRDEVAAIVIELHVIPHDERGVATAGYRIGGDQSAGSLASPDDKCQLKAGWLPTRTQVVAFTSVAIGVGWR
jgi:hypothetical protein